MNFVYTILTSDISPCLYRYMASLYILFISAIVGISGIDTYWLKVLKPYLLIYDNPLLPTSTIFSVPLSLSKTSLRYAITLLLYPPHSPVSEVNTIYNLSPFLSVQYIDSYPSGRFETTTSTISLHSSLYFSLFASSFLTFLSLEVATSPIALVIFLVLSTDFNLLFISISPAAPTVLPPKELHSYLKLCIL